MKKALLYIAALTLAAVMPAQASAGILGDGIDLMLRAGYSVGGTSPLAMPASIRSIDAFRIGSSFSAGGNITKTFGGRWGLTSGLLLESKTMDADVTVKGYHMEIVQGDSKIEGVFTGHVHQQVSLLMLTLPLQASFKADDKLTLHAGPYASLLLKKEFKGVASDGYLRQGDPTGPRIAIGDTPETNASYDFSDQIRSWQLGIAIGADYRIVNGLAIFANLSWGLTPLFPSDFTTVEQALYPIYGTLGLSYTL